MSRCIVNVATGRYREGQSRLREALDRFDKESHREFYDSLPKHWPSHSEVPYGFKAYALNHARDKGYDLLLWLDASVVPVKPLKPLWEKIEREGYWIARNGWTNYEWTADSAYSALFPDMTPADAREINKTIPHVVATAFGINLWSYVGWSFLVEYSAMQKAGAFCGPWKNTPETPCGPPDVLGHRHDQTAASVIAWSLGMKLTDCPEIFSYPPGREDSILMAVGA